VQVQPKALRLINHLPAWIMNARTIYATFKFATKLQDNMGLNECGGLCVSMDERAGEMTAEKVYAAALSLGLHQQWCQGSLSVFNLDTTNCNVCDGRSRAGLKDNSMVLWCQEWGRASLDAVTAA